MVQGACLQLCFWLCLLEGPVLNIACLLVGPLVCLSPVPSLFLEWTLHPRCSPVSRPASAQSPFALDCAPAPGSCLAWPGAACGPRYQWLVLPVVFATPGTVRVSKALPALGSPAPGLPALGEQLALGAPPLLPGLSWWVPVHQPCSQLVSQGDQNPALQGSLSASPPPPRRMDLPLRQSCGSPV